MWQVVQAGPMSDSACIEDCQPVTWADPAWHVVQVLDAS
jgi:hypothetical protein